MTLLISPSLLNGAVRINEEQEKMVKNICISFESIKIKGFNLIMPFYILNQITNFCLCHEVCVQIKTLWTYGNEPILFNNLYGNARILGWLDKLKQSLDVRKVNGMVHWWNINHVYFRGWKEAKRLNEILIIIVKLAIAWFSWS